jgi:branched-chain amino acid transport system permease protein
MGSLAGAAVDRRATWSRALSADSAVRVALLFAFVALGVFAPAVIASSYWLGLLVSAMILGLAALSIGFLAHQCGLMMFGVSALTGGATYVYAIAIASLGLGALAASVFTLVACVLFYGLIGAMVVGRDRFPSQC